MVDSKPNTLTWLHFSDLHLSSANTSDPILTALLDRINHEASKEDGFRPDLLFCSGDIACSGKMNEYETAKEFFNKLLETTRVEKAKLCIVPGNHDVDLTVEDKQIRALQHALIEGECESKQCFEDSATRESLIARFPGFQSFCDLFLERPFDQVGNNYFAVILPTKGFRIGFIGFNSAWFSKGGKEDDRRLFLGVSSFRKVFEKLERQGKPDLTIVMLHHPIDWLVEEERYAIMDLLLEKADVVLTGHTHRGSAHATYTSPKGRKVLFLEVGATDQAEKRPSRAFFVQVDVGSRKFKVCPITFENNQWVNDTRIFPDIKDGCAIFDLMVVQRRATLRVENKELEKAANRIPFMENQAAGKFVKEKAWGNVKNELDFSLLRPLDLTGSSKIYLIKGKPGMGKSTYLLWSLDESLHDGSCPFDQIVFLHPEYYELWAEELYDCDPERTLLVIDALRRGTDTDSRFVDRCLELQTLAFEGKKVNEQLIGPFKILATIRDDDYIYLMKQKAFEWMSPEVFDITPKKLVPERILKRLLATHKLSNEISAGREKEVMEKLATKSEGSPFYIRHLVEELRIRNMSFSERALEEYPEGMVNLIWHVLTNKYYIKDDDFIPFVLLLLLKTDKFFSDHFLNFAIERMVRTQKKEVEEKVALLESSYLQDFTYEVDQRQSKGFTLSSHWKQSLKTGLEQPDSVALPYRDTVLSYKKIEDLHFARLTDEIVKKLEIHLGEGFKATGDAFLCVDLAKIGRDCLEYATKLYIDFHSSSKLQGDHLEYIRDELFELWISKAWEYIAQYDDAQVITCYENAFERLGVRSDYEQLHAYAYYLRKRILPSLKYGTLEFQKCREKTEGIFKEVISNQSDRRAKLMSYQSLASFYAELGEDEKAENVFKEILEADPSYFPARHAYAIFLKEKGKRELTKDHKKASEYFRASENQFKKLLLMLEDAREKLPQKQLEEEETRLLNAYAIFLVDKTELERSFDDRLRIDTEVNELFEKVLRKYPRHGRSVCAYSLFLIRYAWILPKYKGGENLKKVEKVLKDFIEFEKGRKEKSLSYFIALEIQAKYLSRIRSPFYKQTLNWEEIEKILKESTRSFDPYHNSIAYLSLGRLYMGWANVFRKKEDLNGYDEKMDLAKKAHEKAVEIVPENRLSANHLSRVYLSYAFCLKYIGEKLRSVEYMKKAIELAQNFAYMPLANYSAICHLGNEMLQDQDTELARVAFTEAKKTGEKLGIVPSYAIFRLGEVCKQEHKIDEALQHYVLSARLENTSEAWGTRRDSIRRLMDELGIRKSESPTIYGNCIDKRLECSKEALQHDQNSWKNCGDYGEDLLAVGEFEEAIRELEKGVGLVQQSNELVEVDKKKKLSWFYEKIGFCHKDQGNSMKAEEYLLRAAETEDSGVGYFRAIGWMFELHSFEKALMAFRKFVEKFASCEEKEKLLPNIANAVQKIAISYENLGKEHEAASIWKDYAAISFYSNPQDGANECGKSGNKLMKLNRFLEAKECFLKSNRLNPNQAKNLSQLGSVNKMLQKWEECAICSQKAFEIRGDYRDREDSEFCQRQLKKGARVFDPNSVEDMMDKAALSEISGRFGDALEHYFRILDTLKGQNNKERAKLSIRRFVADAFWILGRRSETLELYEEIRDAVASYEKMIVETIIWFIKNALDRQTDLDVKERILSLLKAGPLKGENQKAISVEIGKRFGIEPTIIEKLLDNLYAEKLIRKANFTAYSPSTNSTHVSVVLSLAEHGQENHPQTTKMNPNITSRGFKREP